MLGTNEVRGRFAPYLNSFLVTKAGGIAIKISMSVITKFLPKRVLSRGVGRLMHWQGPRWWARLTVRAFARFYKINLEEAEKDYTAYVSIGDFFVRKLKPGLRPVGETWAVHPADSEITQCAPIDNGTLIQAKGLTYRLTQFTQDPLCIKSGLGDVLSPIICVPRIIIGFILPWRV